MVTKILSGVFEKYSASEPYHYKPERRLLSQGNQKKETFNLNRNDSLASLHKPSIKITIENTLDQTKELIEIPLGFTLCLVEKLYFSKSLLLYIKLFLNVQQR